MSKQASDTSRWGTSAAGFRSEAEAVVTMLRAYARQELVDPLRTLGRYVAFGVLGAIFVAISALLFATALLRVLQEEASVFDGNWSFAPYLITAVFCVLVVVAAITRIGADRRSRETDEASGSHETRQAPHTRSAQREDTHQP